MTALHVRMRYPASPADVFAMLTDPEFLRQKFDARGETDIVIEECAALGEEFRIVSRRTVVVQVPSFARRVIHPSNAITQTDIWEVSADGVRSGRWRADVHGVPVSMHGTMRLEADGTGSVETIEGTVSSSIPLIGGRIEKLVADTARTSLQREEEFAARWLESVDT